MRLTVSNNLKIENPSVDIVKFCHQELVMSNPEYEKKQRLGFWMGNTPKKINMYSTEGSSYVLPYGCIYEAVDIVGRKNISADFQFSEPVPYMAHIPLYDYQQKAVERMSEYVCGILQAPAGSGKTQMGIAMITQYGKRALWITHTKDLLQQSYNRAKQYIDDDLLGTITEGKINIGSGITFATVQTLAKINLDEYKNYWDMIVVDECHRVAGTPTQLTQFYKVLNTLSARRKYGLSATVHRADGLIKATYALIGKVRYSVPEEDVGDKIVKVGIKPVGTGVEICDYCLNDDGTLNYTSLITYLTENISRNNTILQAIIDDRDKSALILSERVVHLERLMNSLPESMRKDAVLINGKMTSKKGKAEREQAIADMQSGEKKYLFATYSLAKEGLDIPRLERLFMATPVKDYAVVVQSVGRIARKFDGKAEPICVDFVDKIGYLQKAYKKRWTSYRKCGCYEVEE